MDGDWIVVMGNVNVPVFGRQPWPSFRRTPSNTPIILPHVRLRGKPLAQHKIDSGFTLPFTYSLV